VRIARGSSASDAAAVSRGSSSGSSDFDQVAVVQVGARDAPAVDEGPVHGAGVEELPGPAGRTQPRVLRGHPAIVDLHAQAQRAVGDHLGRAPRLAAADDHVLQAGESEAGGSGSRLLVLERQHQVGLWREVTARLARARVRKRGVLDHQVRQYARTLRGCPRQAAARDTFDR
jgi:hypothetical protein